MKHKKAKPDEITERMKVAILLTVEELRKRVITAETKLDAEDYVFRIERLTQLYKELIS